MRFIRIYILVLIVFCLIFPAPVVFSASESFPVQSLVGGDVTSPSTPTSLVATGIATTQIDLSWSSSTDNFALSGYHIWRDDVHIATTTLPLYSDTGLTANTSYIYYVVAFDVARNFSASSSVATGTTLSTPPPTPTTATTEETGGNQQGTRIRPLANEIQSLVILPNTDSVVIRYVTEGNIRSIVQWGQSSSYEMGSLIEKSFAKSHEITITGLTPGTKYVFAIEGENGIGRRGTMHMGTFVTLPPDDVFPPPNVMNLRAEKEGDDIRLTWTNPTDTDFSKIRIVQSDRFYPSDIADGKVIYEGRDERALDMGRGKETGQQYYTVFSYDALGNISSGAVVSVEGVSIEGGDEPTVEDADPAKNEISLSFSDLIFTQEGIVRTVENGEVAIDGTKQLTIALPYDRVPEHLKTILVRIENGDADQKSFSFLLRINRDKSAYVSILAPFGVSGRFPVTLSVFDFKTAQIGYADGIIKSGVHSTEPIATNTESLFSLFVQIFVKYAYILLFVILLLCLTYVGRRLMHATW